ncbi:ABC transporter ATP-binding protein [Castellaniella sp.]|uniref:ABC transporter ATP-binding protein n=1 Tax=Castellaniella sp. TaxID=1955812 RepID=UPI00355F7A0C
MADNVLEVRHVRKRFGGLEVLTDVSLTAADREIVAIIGPNGAGKTTLFNIIAGVIRPDEGAIVLAGHDITREKPFRRCKMGVARTFQIPKPFLQLNVLENIEVALQFGHHAEVTEDHRRRALAWLERVGLERWAHETTDALPLGARKKLELVRALATQPRIILCDEVMGGLSPEEVDEMSEIIRALPNDGITVLFVEHVMRATMKVADRITVLHRGCIIANGAPQDIAENPEVIEAYLGSSEHTEGTPQ